MIDVIVVVLTLASSAPEMGQAVMDAAPITTSQTVPLAAGDALPAPQSAQPESVREESTSHVPTTSVWDRLAQCESGGRWDLNVGLYDGGLQFHPKTWAAAGGTQYAEFAWQATREQQIAVAESWLAKTSWAQWPACSRKLGLR